MAKDPFSRSITVRLGVGVPLLVGALLLSGLYVGLPTFREELEFIALVFGGAAAIYSAFYVGAAARDGSDRERMCNTFALIRAVDEPELLKLREALDKEIDHRRAAPEEILEKINEREELRIAVRGLLNTFEDVAVAIRMGYADERLVFAAMGGMMRSAVIKYSSFIEAERKRHASDRVYRELEVIAGSWKSKQYHTLKSPIPDDPCQ